MVLHALEDDHAIAFARLDHGLLHLEVSASVHLLDFHFEQAFDGLVERLLDFTHADAAPLLIHDVSFNHQLGKHV